MNQQPRSSSKSRRYDIDWLRILAVLLLIPFHTARIFDIWQAFYAKNPQTSPFLSYFLAFVNPWHMPLFFVVAGAATYFALGFRSGGQYTIERLKRLAIPFIFGVLVIVPPESYYALLTNHIDPGGYFNFYPHFFSVKNGDLSGYFGGFTPGHLWFILFLFVFSLVALPLFLYWRQHRRFIEGLATFCEKPGVIYLLSIPIGIAGLLPSIGGENPFFYLTLFILGYVLMADERFQISINRQMWVSLILGIVTMSITLGFVIANVQFVKYSVGDIFSTVVSNFNTWFWVLALLGLGYRFLNFNHRLLPYFAEAAYPFYILHQTVIVIIGYYVVQSTLGIPLKFAIIALLSLFTTLLIYDVVVRRFNLLRFLFGMKPKHSVQPTVLLQPKDAAI